MYIRRSSQIFATFRCDPHHLFGSLLLLLSFLLFASCGYYYNSPIAAALSAHGFVADAVANLDTLPPSIKEVEGRDNNSVDSLLPTLHGDVAIIGSSLYFVDDFLRSILDMHASEENKLHVQLAPADLSKDVLDPVRSILHQRDTGIEVQVECPENLLVMTDTLRLKQVRTVNTPMLNGFWSPLME